LFEKIHYKSTCFVLTHDKEGYQVGIAGEDNPDFIIPFGKDFQSTFTEIFKKIRVKYPHHAKFEDKKCLITYATYLDKAMEENRKHLSEKFQHLFHYYKFKSLCFRPVSLLALTASGKTSGFVVDFLEQDWIFVVTIIEGFPVRELDYFYKDTARSDATNISKNIIQGIKGIIQKIFKLPNGQMIQQWIEYALRTIIFIGLPPTSDVSKIITQNLQNTFEGSKIINIENSQWVGGSIMASLPSANNLAVTQEAYTKSLKSATDYWRNIDNSLEVSATPSSMNEYFVTNNITPERNDAMIAQFQNMLKNFVNELK